MDDKAALPAGRWPAATVQWRIAGITLDYSAKAVTEIPGEDAFYLLDSSNNVMRKLNLHDGKPVTEETMEYGKYTLWDLAYSNYFSQEGTPRTYAVGGSTL